MTETKDLLTNFKEEHREIRDTVYALTEALRIGDVLTARTQLERLNDLAGPHFRYEEERMYPELVDLFPEGYIEDKLKDHDGAIATGHYLAKLLEQDELSEVERKQAADRALQLIIHVSDCDGLAVIMERLPETAMDAIAAIHTDAYKANVPLLDWADSIRERPQE